MAITAASIKGIARGIVSAIASTADEARADHVLQGRYHGVSVNDAATAGTAVTEFCFYKAQACAVRVKSAQVVLPVTATGHASNFATITLSKKTAGGASTAIATWATDSAVSGQGTLTAFVWADMALVAGAVELASGDSLTIKVVKAGTGVALTAATSLAWVQALLEEGA